MVGLLYVLYFVSQVINFMLPATLEHYIHRVGRTARAGRAGVSVSLAGESERKLVKQIIKRARNPVKSRVIPPGSHFKALTMFKTRHSKDIKIDNIIPFSFYEIIVFQCFYEGIINLKQKDYLNSFKIIYCILYVFSRIPTIVNVS